MLQVPCYALKQSQYHPHNLSARPASLSVTVLIAFQDSYVVELQAEATGIHRDGPKAIPDTFVYNIGSVNLN